MRMIWGLGLSREYEEDEEVMSSSRAIYHQSLGGRGAGAGRDYYVFQLFIFIWLYNWVLTANMVKKLCENVISSIGWLIIESIKWSI